MGKLFSGRLKLLASGIILLMFGLLRMWQGTQVVPHWTGQPMFSWGLVAAGAVCLFLAMVPFSWIRQASRLRKAR